MPCRAVWALRNGHALTRAIPGPGKREWIEHLLLAILALLAAGLALPEVDPELDTREEPFFDKNSRQMIREQLAERFGSGVLDPESRTRPPSPVTLQAFTWL